MLILTIFVLAIIALQIYLFLKTGNLINKLKEVLSGHFTTGLLPDEDVTVIMYDAEKKDVLSLTIEASINTYLRKNKGAVSDFNLIKDIVERNCDTLENEISAQTPLPLYLGLMGTVAGIVLGLFTIGDFSQIDKVIGTLMQDVAVAMIASFMGICFTTLTLWKSKECKSIVEANKNAFYTWIQTNLLPVLSQSAVSAITLLQQNLTRFNQSFTHTVERLEEKMEGIGESYEWQIEILNKIQAIDINKMATANVKILSALNSSTGNLQEFTKYMGEVTDYLNAVRDLNDKLDLQLERTNTLQVVSDFYRSQMKEIGLRQDAIKAAVVGVDDVMKSTLADLQANSEKGLKSMQETFVNQMMAMQDMITTQTEALTKQMNVVPHIVAKLEDVSKIPAALTTLTNRMEESNKTLIRNLTQAFSRSSATPVSPSGKLEPYAQYSTHLNNGATPAWMRWCFLIILALIAVFCFINLCFNIGSTTPETPVEGIAISDSTIVVEKVKEDAISDSAVVVYKVQEDVPDSTVIDSDTLLSAQKPKK